MDKYKVKLSPHADRDLDDFYSYIALHLLEPDIALHLVDRIEAAILGLEDVPYRGAKRKIGQFADRGYRELFVGNYTIVYRVDEESKTVVIITARYTPSRF